MDGTELPTEIPGVTLRPITVDEAELVWALMVRNRPRLDDWNLPTELTIDRVTADYITHPPLGRTTYGIWHDRELCGTISLTPAEPPHWAIGYFLDAGATGRGLATAACRTLTTVARDSGAVDLYAIVTTGNEGSAAVLRRTGFVMIQELTTATRWWLPLREDPDPPVMV